jgi:hypothetical protein
MAERELGLPSPASEVAVRPLPLMLVRARGEQRADDLGVAEETRPDQRRPTVYVNCICINAPRKELALCCEFAMNACGKKRRLIGAVRRLDVRAPVAQLAHARQFVTACRPVQTRFFKVLTVLKVDNGLPQRVVAAHAVGVGGTHPGRDVTPRPAAGGREAFAVSRREKGDDERQRLVAEADVAREKERGEVGLGLWRRCLRLGRWRRRRATRPSRGGAHGRVLARAHHRHSQYGACSKKKACDKASLSLTDARRGRVCGEGMRDKSEVSPARKEEHTFRPRQLPLGAALFKRAHAHGAAARSARMAARKPGMPPL